MRAQASVEPGPSTHGQKAPPPPPPQDSSAEGALSRLRIWQQVLLAEVLNLLEHGRYDLKD